MPTSVNNTATNNNRVKPLTPRQFIPGAGASVVLWRKDLRAIPLSECYDVVDRIIVVPFQVSWLADKDEK